MGIRLKVQYDYVGPPWEQLSLTNSDPLSLLDRSRVELGSREPDYISSFASTSPVFHSPSTMIDKKCPARMSRAAAELFRRPEHERGIAPAVFADLAFGSLIVACRCALRNHFQSRRPHDGMHPRPVALIRLLGELFASSAGSQRLRAASRSGLRSCRFRRRACRRSHRSHPLHDGMNPHLGPLMRVLRTHLL